MKNACNHNSNDILSGSLEEKESERRCKVYSHIEINHLSAFNKCTRIININQYCRFMFFRHN